MPIMKRRMITLESWLLAMVGGLVLGAAEGCADNGVGSATEADSGSESQNDTEVDQPGDIPDCASADPIMTACDEVGALCSTAVGCCKCVSFEAASCEDSWDCANPTLNGEGCPEAMPTLESPCETEINLSCQYCADDGPRFVSCRTASLIWTEASGLSCDE